MFVWKCFKIIENALEKILLGFKTFQVFLVKCTSYVLLVVSTLSASLKTFSISLKVLSDEVDDVVEFVTCVTPTSKCKIINYFLLLEYSIIALINMQVADHIITEKITTCGSGPTNIGMPHTL